MIALPEGKKSIRQRVNRIQKGSCSEERKGPADTGTFRGRMQSGNGREISTLYETGSYDEMLHQMKVQRCVLIDEMHESQRKVDRMDFLIRNQEKQMK